LNGHGDRRMVRRPRLNPEFILIFLVASVFWAGVLAWQASGPPDLEKQRCYENAKKTAQKIDECKSFWEKATTDPVAAFTAVLAVSTVGLWIATIGLYLSGQNQFRLARQEFIATHRPKIIVHAAELTRSPPEDKIDEENEWYLIGASLLCFNVGESIAKHVEVRGQIFAGANFGLDVQRPIVKVEEEVLNGQKLRAEIKSNYPVVDVASGKRRGVDYFCLGWIAYFDENGHRRETGFCFRAEFGAHADLWVSAGKPEYEYDY
jgi:hypothetical protein